MGTIGLRKTKETNDLPRRSGDAKNDKTKIGLKQTPNNEPFPKQFNRHDVPPTGAGRHRAKNDKDGLVLDKDITVEPYFFESIPKDWWAEADFWLEMGRFWGSLGRVLLVSFGIVTGPR